MPHKIQRSPDKITNSDAEFCLKLAVYIRDDLGLRGSANFIAALCAYHPNAQPYLLSYFRKIVAIPSDWLQIATFARDIPLRTTRGLPNALRLALAAIFVKFNEHSLAKYNKEGAQKARKKRAADAIQDDDDDGEEESYPYTFKQLIRMLHIGENSHYYVMCLLGKRYPMDTAQFSACGLDKDGRTFEPERAGQRMRLAIPMTWETENCAVSIG